MSFHFSYDWKQVRRCWCKKMKISQSHTREEAWGPELIFVTDITDFIRGEKTVMWRNFSFLYRIWTIYGVLSKFMPFCSKFMWRKICAEEICVEKKWQIWGLVEFRLEICQKIYMTEFLGQKFYTLKVRKLRLILLKRKQRKCINIR